MKKRIGIIGGSGLYQIEGMKIKERVKGDTPFGDPSDELDIGELYGREVVFLPRHARGHKLIPSEINYRANIWAMKKMDVSWIISISAVGSYKKEIKPLDFVLVDQFFDRTHGRKSTFFGDGIAGHIMFAYPVCPHLRSILLEAGKVACEGTTIHDGGTYVNMEDPAFSTRAESQAFKSMGFDVVGMTNMTEARLAREAEICFATVAMVTDYDCWLEEDPESSVSVEVILNNLNKNVQAARNIIRETIHRIPEERHCVCAFALKNAVITRSELFTPEAKERLDLLLNKYYKNGA
jgi:5'-methylthioadenosine phosphorylase